MAATGAAEKQVMVVGIDESDHSMYALEWILDRFFTPYSPNPPFKLVVVHAKPPPGTRAGLTGPAAATVIKNIDADLKVIASRVLEKAKKICSRKSIQDVVLKALDGDPRNVLCDAVEKHHASILVVGSRGYGAIKRALLGSVSDHCAHHVQCTVMIVKRPKIKN